MASSSHFERSDLPPLRRFLDQYGSFVAGGLLLLALVFVFINTRNPQRPKAYYTEDDGKTWFVDDLAIAPVMHHGHECPRVMMYTCDDGKTLFVGYLMRYTPETKPRAEAELKRGGPVSNDGMQVKRPGESEWVEAFNPRKLNASNAKKMLLGGGMKKFDEITRPKCPDGKPAWTHNPT